LRELGYVYGEHFVTEPRGAKAGPTATGALAAELVRLQVDVIVASGPMLPRSNRQPRRSLSSWGAAKILWARDWSRASGARAETSRAEQSVDRHKREAPRVCSRSSSPGQS
jgi:hypothetical protein